MPFGWQNKPINRDPSVGGNDDDGAPSESSMLTPSSIDDKSSSPLSSSLPLPLTSGGGQTKDNANATISEPWTRIFPEAYGIRKAIEDSPFRWCVRESSLWAVATGTVMGIHRLRMGSRSLFAGKVAFGTAFLVVLPSYYFCYRKREHQEHVIELMMAVNDFRPTDEMPETIPMDKDHPFLDVRDKVDGGKGGSSSSDRDLQKEFVARLKEKKEWQEPYQTQDAGDVFKEVKKK